MKNQTNMLKAYIFSNIIASNKNHTNTKYISFLLAVLMDLSDLGAFR